MVMSSNEIRQAHYDHHHHHHHELSDEEDPSIDLKCNIPEIKEFDPKIRDLLDDLNRYSTKINQLEQCFQEENSKFHRVLNESSVRLNKIMKKCGDRNVTTSRPYYAALQKINDLKIKCQTEALKFEKYNELYLIAKQAISDAELMFHKNMKEDGQFDQYWQEKLNCANLKFMEAKVAKEKHETEHMFVMTQIRALEYDSSDMKAKNKASIKKAKPYFDEANSFDAKLKKIKDDIKLLEMELAKCKNDYSQTLKRLENISEEIHEKRAQYLALKREPGVGAEIIDQSCLIESFSDFKVEDDISATTSSSSAANQQPNQSSDEQENISSPSLSISTSSSST